MDVVKLPDVYGVPQEKLRRLAAHVSGLSVGTPHGGMTQIPLTKKAIAVHRTNPPPHSQHYRYVPPSGYSNFFMLDVLTNVLG